MTGSAPRPKENYERALAIAERIVALQTAMPRRSLEKLAKDALVRVAAKRVNVIANTNSPPSTPEIERLCTWLLGDTDPDAEPFIRDLLSAGLPRRFLFDDWFAPAAAQLGEMWENDKASFVQVAYAMGRLQGLVRVLPRENISASDGRAAVFSTVPGETHSLGLRMAADLFRDKGWDITVFFDLTHEDLLAGIDASGLRLIGLSATGNYAIPSLMRVLSALHLSALGNHVILCGQIAKDAPQGVRALVDGSATTIDEAFALFEDVHDNGRSADA